MKNVAFTFPNAGEQKTLGYAGEVIDFTVQKQYLDRETWKVLVNQFRIHSDVDNDWRGEFWGKLMRGASLTYRATKNRELYDVLVETVNDILSTQEPSGRISSYPIEKELRGWDMWARKYVMLGLLYFLDVCTKKTLKKKITVALKRQANYILKRVGAGRRKSIFDTSQIYGGLNSCSILEPFVKLYMLTGEKRYLDFSTDIVNAGFCTDLNLIDLCLKKELYPYQFKHTKAYEMMSCFEGLIEYYKVTGNDDHLRAVENFVDMVVETDYTIIGCSGCTHELFDNSTAKQTEKTQEVMQETCVTVTFMKLCAKLLSLTGNAKYAGYIERSGLNALLGAANTENQTMHRAEARKWIGKDLILLEHEPFPFDSYSPLYQDRRCRRVAGFKELQNGRSYGCCACISGAGTAILGLFSVMKSENGFFVNLYNDGRFHSTFDGAPVKIKTYANPYGKNGARIHVYGKGKTFTLGLRVPEWAKNFEVTCNGNPVQGTMKNGYLTFTQVWNNDVLLLSYSTPVREVVKNKKVAFERGPIVLARDCRFEDITKPVALKVKNGKVVRATAVKNPLFKSNITLKVKTKDGEITLCDYAQAGKNYDDENCNITVWQDVARS